MDKKWFIFIESNTTGTGLLYAKSAAENGFIPVLFTNDSSQYRMFRENDIKIMRINTFDENLLFDACMYFDSGLGVAGISSSSEYFIKVAARLAKRLGLPSPAPSAIEVCGNKYLQYQSLQLKGVRTPKSILIESIYEFNLDEEWQLPVIVKPVQGSGSVGVKLCRSITEVRDHLNLLLTRENNERGIPALKKALVQEYIKGDEYSVEIFNGKAIGITKKILCIPPDFVETGHDFPAELPSGQEYKIREFAEKSVEILDLKWGPIHVEVRYDKHGPVMIEVNPRLAGGYIPKLVQYAMNINLIDETIKLATGLHCGTYNKISGSRYASIRFIIPRTEGMLSAIKGVDAAKKAPGITEVSFYRAVGDYLQIHGDFRDRIGHVISVSSSSTEASNGVEDAKASIILDIKKEDIAS